MARADGAKMARESAVSRRGRPIEGHRPPNLNGHRSSSGSPPRWRWFWSVARRSPPVSRRGRARGVPAEDEHDAFVRDELDVLAAHDRTAAEVDDTDPARAGVELGGLARRHPVRSTARRWTSQSICRHRLSTCLEPHAVRCIGFAGCGLAREPGEPGPPVLKGSASGCISNHRSSASFHSAISRSLNLSTFISVSKKPQRRTAHA